MAGSSSFGRRIRIGNRVSAWRLRFIKAQVLDLRGKTDEALLFLESFAPPDPSDRYSTGALKMHRASSLGYLGHCEASHTLFAEAEALAREARLDELLGDIHLSQAFIFFRQKDYVSSDALFRAALEISSRVGGWYLRGYGLWGIG